MKKRFLGFIMGFALPVLLFVSGLIVFARDKVAYVRDFIVDSVAGFFTLPKTKIPIVLGRVQSLMRDYFNKYEGFASAVWSMNGFTHKLAVNAFA